MTHNHQPISHSPQPSAPERAASWLRSRIKDGTWHQGDTLPSLQVLATRAGVSRRTMRRAVAVLKAEKLISVRRGRSITIGEAAPETGEPGSCETIIRQVTDAVFGGEFLPGMALPPISKLEHRFGSCYRTVHRALSILTQKRLLVHTGSRYLVPLLGTRGMPTEIILFNEAVFDNDRQRATVLVTENLTQRLGLRCVRYEHSLSLPFNTVEIQRLINRDSVAGFMVDFWGVGSPDRTHHFNTLLALLYATRKPVALIDQVGTMQLGEPFRSSSRIREYTIASTVAGEDIGRALLKSGHRKAAFLTTTSHQLWSERRYSGLRLAFGGITPPGKVILCEAAELPGSAVVLVCAAARLSQKEVEVLLRPRIPLSEVEIIVAAARQVAEILTLDPAEESEIRKQVKSVITLCSIGNDRSLSDGVQDRLFENIGSRIEQRILEPTFKKLIADRTITAWVAAREEIGLAANAFLRKRAAALPNVPALIAFDNTSLSTMAELSSYDFDMPGLLNQALSFAAGRAGTDTRVHKAVEWPGVLCYRQSMKSV